MKRLVFSKIVSRQTFRNLTLLMTGSMLATVISLFTAPVTARLFIPEHFGTWAIIISASSLLGILAYSHFPNLILLEQEPEKVNRALSLSVFTNAAVCIVALLLIALAGTAVSVFHIRTFDFRYLLIPVFTFLSGTISILLIWSNRYARYKLISLNRLLQVLIPVMLQLGIGFFILASANVILFSQLTGLCICSGLLCYRFSADLRNCRFNWPAFREMGLTNKALIAVSLPAELINNFSNQLPVFFLQRYSGERAVGLFSMSNRLFSLPVSFITSSIGEVFRQKAAIQYQTQGSCRKLVVKTSMALFLITLLPFIGGMIFAPDLFAFVFGENWREAGEYARLIGILFFFKTVMSPVSYVIYIARKFYLTLIIDIVVLAVSLLAIIVGIYVFHSVKTALFLYALSYALLYFLTFYLSYRFSVNKNFYNAEATSGKE